MRPPTFCELCLRTDGEKGRGNAVARLARVAQEPMLCEECRTVWRMRHSPARQEVREVRRRVYASRQYRLTNAA